MLSKLVRYEVLDLANQSRMKVIGKVVYYIFFLEGCIGKTVVLEEGITVTTARKDK